MKQYSYDKVISIIENTRRFGKTTGLEVSKRMLEQLGNPQSGIPFVHVAGTNGKGSTTAFLSKIIEQTGKKVGMFTSPHLVHFEERIRINGKMISKQDVERLGNDLLEMEFDVTPTMFDYCLVMAMLYFKEQGCDFMVIETGLGGRYDSTNAIGVPEVAIITKIGFDHMAVLGNTLEEIAHEKAGIIKKGCSVVLHDQPSEVKQVIKETFFQVNQYNERMDNIQMNQVWEEGPAFYIASEADYRFVEEIPRKMVGDYQLENAATAALAARVLFNKCLKDKANGSDTLQEQIDDYIRIGIRETFWRGRMEIINDAPFFMVDGAHNSHGVRALASSLKELYPGEKFHFIMGVMADKDYEEMIDALLPLAIDFITVTPESERALQSKDLAECIQRKGIPARYVENLETVIYPLLPKNKHATTSCHKTVAFGSLYFIGAIEAMLGENGKQV